MDRHNLADKVGQLGKEAEEQGELQAASVLYTLAGTLHTNDDGLNELHRINAAFAAQVHKELERLRR